MTEKLSETARKTTLEPLLEAGWSMVEGRDAIASSVEVGVDRGLKLSVAPADGQPLTSSQRLSWVLM